jgi:hypothetical protein
MFSLHKQILLVNSNKPRLQLQLSEIFLLWSEQDVHNEDSISQELHFSSHSYFKIKFFFYIYCLNLDIL